MQQYLSSKKTFAKWSNVAASMVLHVKRKVVNASSLTLSVMRWSSSTGRASKRDGSQSLTLELFAAISAVAEECAMWWRW
jgi:hypothetical protein